MNSLSLNNDDDVITINLISLHLAHAVLVHLFRVQMTRGLTENNCVEDH